MITEMQAVSAMRVYTTAETRGNSGRDSPGSLLVSHCQLSEAKPSVKDILVPIFCRWVLRILYNTGISCCEKAGKWQLAATTLATIIEETTSFKRVQHTTLHCLDVCRSGWQMRLVTMLLSVLARRVENGNGCLGLPKASGFLQPRFPLKCGRLSHETYMFAQGGTKMQ